MQTTSYISIFNLSGGEGLCNPAFNDSTLPEQNESDLESKRTSRESGIYASSESRVDKQEDIAPVPSTSRALQSDVLNNNDNDIPADLLMASYKTFDNQPRSRHHIDTHARRSYPRAITHSTGAGGEKTGQPVERY